MILSQYLWLVFLPSYPFCFAFLTLELKPIHHSQQNTIKQLKSLSIILGQWKTIIGIIQNGYIYVVLNQIICVCRENPSSSLQQLTRKNENKMNKSSCLEVFCKKGVLRNSTKLTGKYLCQCLFSCEFCRISKNSLFTEHLQWVLFSETQVF